MSAVRNNAGFTAAPTSTAAPRRLTAFITLPRRELWETLSRTSARLFDPPPPPIHTPHQNRRAGSVIAAGLSRNFYNQNKVSRWPTRCGLWCMKLTRPPHSTTNSLFMYVHVTTCNPNSLLANCISVVMYLLSSHGFYWQSQTPLQFTFKGGNFGWTLFKLLIVFSWLLNVSNA